jgi:hypothetical protein
MSMPPPSMLRLLISVMSVQCLHQGILPSMTRMLPVNSILLPNKSHPFSIVREDDTDSICDLPCLLTYLDNFASKRHKANATRSPATGGNSRRSSNGAAAPSSLPSSSSLPQPPFFASNASAAAAAPTAGICRHSLSRPRRRAHKVRFFCIPWRLVPLSDL